MKNRSKKFEKAIKKIIQEINGERIKDGRSPLSKDNYTKIKWVLNALDETDRVATVLFALNRIIEILDE